MDVREKVLAILESTCPGVDFEAETALIDDEVIESLDIVTIIAEIMETFSIDLNVNDILPENFNTVDAMVALVSDRLG